jgi:DNA polymerase-3 subunit gamma/tau
MSYQVLARKWRPGTFAEMVGQQHVLQALVNALESGRLHHAYLFTGTRGVGKTTVARILAKCLNCDTGLTATPCGECGACAEIAEGRSVDLIEVDAASKTGVDDMRELLENVQYTPTRARYKIYLIDEVHMLSKNSFAALLKTLEEPPPHAMFLFATTDPQKLPATVLSRCLQFNLKNMQPEQIVLHLEHILAAEAIAAEPEALALIARAAEGSMRDALSLTDQAIAYGEGRLHGAEVAEMLGTVDRGRVLDLIAAVLDEDAPAVLNVVARIAEHAPDYVATLDELSSILHQMTVAQMVPGALDTSWPDQARIVDLAALATLDDTQLFWQMAVSGRRDVHLASSARAGLEMILLRMIAFRPAAVIHGDGAAGAPPAKKPEPPAAPVESRSERANQSRSDSAPPSNNTSSRPEMVDSASDVTQRSAAEGGEASDSGGFDQPPAGLPNEGKEDVSPLEAVGDRSPQAGCVLQAEAELGLFALDSNPETTGDVNDDVRRSSPSAHALSDLTPARWPALFERLRFSGILHSIALNLELNGCTRGHFNFTIAQSDAALLNERHAAQLTQALQQQVDESVVAAITIGDHRGLTPASRRAAVAASRLADAEQAIASDGALHSLMRAFDGEIIPGSIRPTAVDVEHQAVEADFEGAAEP